MKFPVIFAGLLSLSAVLCPSPCAAEVVDGSDFFDFDKVKEEDKKKAEAEMEKQEMAADNALPANVREMLDKFTKYQLIEQEIVEHRVKPLREALTAKLSTLAERSSGAEQTAAKNLSKYVTELPLKKRLRPERAIADPNSGERWNDANGREWLVLQQDGYIRGGGARGPWRWLNPQRTLLLIDYWGGSVAHVLVLASPGAMEAQAFDSQGEKWKVKRHQAVTAAAKGPSAEGMKLLQESAKTEAVIRDQSEASIAQRRARVTQWLLDQTASLLPADAVKVRNEAASLAAPKGAVRIRSKASLFDGVYAMPDGRRLEMKPDGSVILNGRPAGATWDWCKDANSTTTLIRFGKEADPSDVWIVRRSGGEKGVIRIATRTDYITAKRE
ncbi:MAG TPA: hypothetical protein VG796_18115 [Verrucomicrobiales bacterium]|nr:hypothetical protein [Verrucomicrobiales bacterium]